MDNTNGCGICGFVVGLVVGCGFGYGVATLLRLPMNSADDTKAFSRNTRLFVWIRALFNARFYYPVFAVFFTDMGLSVAQFLWLNALWALTIVLFEVPSGVLADLVGRRKLVIFSVLSMAIEMLLLILAPQHGGWVLFLVCAVNRVLSGLAEAAASGADEALAYDSVQHLEEDEDAVAARWDGVLVSAMRWRSLAGVLAMLIGGFVFDHERMVSLFGDFPRIISLKLPVILCFVSACVCLVLAYRLVDPVPVNQGNNRPRVGDIGRGMWQAVGWVINTRVIAMLILGGLIIDATARTFVTLLSEYYRLIELPEYAFGVIGACMSLGGWVVPLYVRWLANRFSLQVNMLIVGGIGIIGLTGVSVLVGALGVLSCFVVMMAMMHVGFLLSRSINREAPSGQRASILSVNNLTLNLGYGLFSTLFALRLKQVSFADALPTMPLFLLGGLLVWLLISCVLVGKEKH